MHASIGIGLASSPGAGAARRGDADMLPRNDVVLECGDRVGVLVPRRRRREVAQFFGDSIRGTAEVSYVSIGAGAAIGLLLGPIPISIPGVGKVAPALAGVLLFAIWLGKHRRFAGLEFTMPIPANLVLRNFGLTATKPSSFRIPRARAISRQTARHLGSKDPLLRRLYAEGA